MTINFLAYWLCGRLLIYTLQVFGPLQTIRTRYHSLDTLVSCDFCLGFWVYLFLSFVFNPQIEGLPQDLWVYPLLVALISAFLMHVFVQGWQAKFQIIHLD